MGRSGYRVPAMTPSREDGAWGSQVSMQAGLIDMALHLVDLQQPADLVPHVVQGGVGHR